MSIEIAKAAKLKGRIEATQSRMAKASTVLDRIQYHAVCLDHNVGERLPLERVAFGEVAPGRIQITGTTSYAPTIGDSGIIDRNRRYLMRSNGRKAQGAKFLSQRKPREREAVERTDIGAHTATAVAGPMAVVDDLRSARAEAYRVWCAYGTADPSRWRRWARRHGFAMDYFLAQSDTGHNSSAPVYQDAQEFAIVLRRLSDR